MNFIFTYFLLWACKQVMFYFFARAGVARKKNKKILFRTAWGRAHADSRAKSLQEDETYRDLCMKYEGIHTHGEGGLERRPPMCGGERSEPPSYMFIHVHTYIHVSFIFV